MLVMADSSAALNARAVSTLTDLAENGTSSVAYRVLTSPQQQIGAHCHRWTVANEAPKSTDAVVYDWTDRVVLDTLRFARNGFGQTVPGSAQCRLLLTGDDLSGLEWGALVLHFWVRLEDLTTGLTATFDFGSWVVSEHTRCVDLESAPGLSDRTVHDLALYDRIGWLDIPNDRSWNVDLSSGWSLETEAKRVTELDVWGEVAGSAPFGGATHDMSFRVLQGDAASLDFLEDNNLPYSPGESTWLGIINDLSSIADERGTLAYSDRDGKFVIPAWRGLSGDAAPRPIWSFDTRERDDTVLGVPAVRSRNVWNTPNRWYAIGDARIGADDPSARGQNVLRRANSEFSAESVGRTVTEVLRLPSRDERKLTNFARFAAYCAQQDALEVELETKPLPFLWHNEYVSVVSPRIFGNTTPRSLVASEWELRFDGQPMTLLLRDIPREVDFLTGTGNG